MSSSERVGIQFYVGFSFTRKSIVSSVIRIFTGSVVSHVFLLAVNNGLWKNIYHLDDGSFEIITPEDFVKEGRVITHLYEVPVTDRKKVLRAFLWLATLSAKSDPLFIPRMAMEWLFNSSIRTHHVRYCTEGIAIFLSKAGVESMVEATNYVVSPGEMLQWVNGKNWKRIYGDKQRIDVPDIGRLAQVS